MLQKSIGMLHMLQCLYMYVSSVCTKCCKCSSGCCKSRSGCCIYIHVASACFKCFIRMLQVFHLDVVYVCNDFQVFYRCFASVSKRMFQSVSVVFGRMLLVFHLGVAKIDLVLHMLQWDPPATATYYSCWVMFGWPGSATRAPQSEHR
jgi:hypothetical protein